MYQVKQNALFFLHTNSVAYATSLSDAQFFPQNTTSLEPLIINNSIGQFTPRHWQLNITSVYI